MRPTPAAGLRRQQPALSATLLLCAFALGGCSSLSDALTPAKVDYRNGAVRNTQPLDVPPDLTQLSGDPRYLPPSGGGAVSAVALQKAAGSTPAAAAPAKVAPNQLGSLRIERSGTTRWLVTPQNADQLWPQLREFWQAQGFTLVTDKPEIGVMETDWAENRAKLPQGLVSRTLGSVFARFHDSGERDLYRTRIERSASGTEIYIVHRGATEEYTDANHEQVRWMARPNDPQLEAEMLSRLLTQLAGSEASAAPVVAKAASAPAEVSLPARARALNDRAGVALQVDDDFDRAWRRVGVALDRSGFTVEDRDRAQGVYFVRYVDPKLAGMEEPGFFARTFGGAQKPNLNGARYQISVKSEGSGRSAVAVLDSQGNALRDEPARNITQLLIDQLR
ncbi:MAG: hypothetical protein RJA44_2206 [Pseudomonadota bacterium]